MPVLKHTACCKLPSSRCRKKLKKKTYRRKCRTKLKSKVLSKFKSRKRCNRCKSILPLIKKLRIEVPQTRIIEHESLNIPQTRFIEQERLDVPTENDWKSSLLVNSSLLKLYSYSIINRGEHSSEVMVEISPNGTDFMQDSKMVVPAGTTQAIVPMRYLKYTRFSLKSEQPDQPTTVDIYFQAQTEA